MEGVAALLSRTSSGWINAVGFDLDVHAMLADPYGRTAAVLIAIAACLSTLLGRSVVLAVNRMHRWGFLFAMVLNFLALLVIYGMLAVLVWGAGRWFFDSSVPFVDVVWAVLWAISPLVLGFTIAIPLLGVGIDRLLALWSVLILWSIIDDLFGISGWRGGALAVGASLVTWLLESLWTPLVARGRDWLWRRVTGRPLYSSSRYVLDLASIEGGEADLFWSSARLRPPPQGERLLAKEPVGPVGRADRQASPPDAPDTEPEQAGPNREGHR